MPTAKCPECEAEVHVAADAEIDDLVDCEECLAELEVAGIDPIELGPATESIWDDEDEEDD